MSNRKCQVRVSTNKCRLTILDYDLTSLTLIGKKFQQRPLRADVWVWTPGLWDDETGRWSWVYGFVMRSDTWVNVTEAPESFPCDRLGSGTWMVGPWCQEEVCPRWTKDLGCLPF